MPKLPEIFERAYITGQGIAAVYIVSGPGGPALVRCTRDIALAHRAIRRKWPQADITGVWWVKDRRAAMRIVRAVASGKPTAGRVNAAAAGLGITLTSHAAVLARAAAFVQKFLLKIELAFETGAGRFFNQGYRDQRTAHRWDCTYSQARVRFYRALLRKAST